MTVLLSKRAINILLMLLDLEGSITTQELAENFTVSVRTIKYDLEDIRAWFEQHDETLYSKRNKGIWLDLPDSKRLLLKNEIIDVDRFETYPDQKRRVNVLIFQLLSVKGYLTAQQLADELLVSRNTIVSDLEQVERLLQAYDLTLIRQARQGFTISGEESNVRLLMEFITQKELTEYDIYQIMNYVTKTKGAEKIPKIKFGSGTLFQGCYRSALKKMRNLINPLDQNQFDYAEILSITLRVAIAAARMQMAHTIGTYRVLSQKTRFEQRNEVPLLLLQEVFERYDLPLLADEYFYIYSDLFGTHQRQDMVQLTKQVIESVSKELNYPFVNDRQLFTNLFAHLSLRFTKKHLFINEYNPFSEEIKGKHLALFLAIQSACKQLIQRSVLLVNDSFCAYIALHFLAAQERQQQEAKVVRIVYVCSTGLGVTSLIEQKILEEVPNVELAGFASVLNATEVIQAEKPDLVLSIFPIEEMAYPFIKVSPLLTDTDLSLIREEVDKILLGKRQGKGTARSTKSDVIEKNERIQSQDLLVKAYIIYEELKRMFQTKLLSEYQEAFLLHVLLMTHRITFNKQYEEIPCNREVSHERQEEIRQIECLFAKNELPVNHAEISALLNYLEQPKEEEDGTSNGSTGDHSTKC
ncbi:transcription antiterminator [Enterococcus faecalis]|uniref:BglG family transcription antiterminator n=1 Tax=Enterococcus faecalis TaxID=1351 RepID=UPI002454A48E|nr:transcription antiterminator [Enterococcus faecalis]MDH5042001.1 transcription antiterminator [Enterococcus faecalis]